MAKLNLNMEMSKETYTIRAANRMKTNVTTSDIQKSMFLMKMQLVFQHMPEYRPAVKILIVLIASTAAGMENASLNLINFSPDKSASTEICLTIEKKSP